ncbi:MAG: hypothetical protein UF228_01015 [Lachnospiraceae bacterium]|nr:hypothetical protein [Lachnospiraceae bacterium]
MLLIKDLSARLPYAVIVEHTSGFRGTLHDITVYHMYDENDNVYDAICYTDFFGDEDSIYIEYFKPYLFPLSSMTEEERIAMGNEFAYGQPQKALDILHKRHIDYRGLIPMGLAIDATNKNIY